MLQLYMDEHSLATVLSAKIHLLLLIMLPQPFSVCLGVRITLIYARWRRNDFSLNMRGMIIKECVLLKVCVRYKPLLYWMHSKPLLLCIGEIITINSNNFAGIFGFLCLGMVLFLPLNEKPDHSIIHQFFHLIGTFTLQRNKYYSFL